MTSNGAAGLMKHTHTHTVYTLTQLVLKAPFVVNRYPHVNIGISLHARTPLASDVWNDIPVAFKCDGMYRIYCMFALRYLNFNCRNSMRPRLISFGTITSMYLIFVGIAQG